jgi:hypothetical protein
MLQEAGPYNFLRTIVIILLVIYGLKYIAKYLLPFVLKRAVSKAQERAQQKGSNAYHSKDEMKVGETTIDKRPGEQEMKPSKNVGDYVDYEEVE